LNSTPRLSLSLHNSLSWNVVGEDEAAAATESKARQGHDERRSAIERRAKEGGSSWIVEDLKFGKFGRWTRFGGWRGKPPESR